VATAQPKPEISIQPTEPEITREPAYMGKPVISDTASSHERATLPPLEPVREMAAISAEKVNRPFPGERETKAQRSGAYKTPLVSVSDELSAESISRNIGSSTSSEDSITSIKPQMAPSLRRRAEKKKRGFFKRLFGIR